MTQLEKEVANLNVDWPQVKNVLNDVVVGLEAVSAALPSSLAKTIILSVITMLHMVVSLLPAA